MPWPPHCSARVVALWLGRIAALLWLAAIFIAAQTDVLLSDRVERAWRRARTYLVLRGDPALRARTLTGIAALLVEATALESKLANGPVVGVGH